MNQGTSAAVWLCMGGLALVWGNLSLWHTRRGFRRQQLVRTADLKKSTAGLKPGTRPIGSAKS